jgi:hypothetical protein
MVVTLVLEDLLVDKPGIALSANPDREIRAKLEESGFRRRVATRMIDTW